MIKPPRTRIRSLDSLRGIAALIVLFHHCAQSVPSLESSPLAVHLFNGSAAVLIFFVLSGLVLAMTCIRKDHDHYLPFIIKRFFRIWPPFAVAILASSGLRLLIGHHAVPGATQTFAQNAASPVTMASLISHLGLLGTVGDLDSPMWSLVHEMRISLIFPALVILAVAQWRTALAGAVLICLAAGQIHVADPLLANLSMTVRFAVLFVMGIVIAFKRTDWQAAIAVLPSGTRAILWLACLLGVLASPDFSGPVWTFTTDLRLLFHGFAAAGLILLCATGNRSERWLSRPVPVYLGRISYSLYLWHVVVLTYLVQSFRGFASVPILVCAAAVLSIGIADLSERFIERPTTQFGRDLARKVAKRSFGTDRVAT